MLLFRSLRFVVLILCGQQQIALENAALRQQLVILKREHEPLLQKLHSLSPVSNVFNNLGNLLFAQTKRLTDQRGGFWYSFATGAPAADGAPASPASVCE